MMNKPRRHNNQDLVVTEADLHPHLLARMRQRGVTLEDIELTLREGWQAADARIGTLGKTMVFAYEAEWEGEFYLETEVTVYYRRTEEGIVLLTVKARYGQGFPRR
jgi:hypothetical protein